MARQTKQQQIEELERTLETEQVGINNLQRNLQSYIDRNRQVERELKLAEEKIVELSRDKQWLKQLCQNNSEALNAYMRNK